MSVLKYLTCENGVLTPSLDPWYMYTAPCPSYGAPTAKSEM